MKTEMKVQCSFGSFKLNEIYVLLTVAVYLSLCPLSLALFNSYIHATRLYYYPGKFCMQNLNENSFYKGKHFSFRFFFCVHMSRNRNFKGTKERRSRSGEGTILILNIEVVCGLNKYKTSKALIVGIQSRRWAGFILIKSWLPAQKQEKM